MPLAIPPGFAHIAIEHQHDLDPDPWYTTFGVQADEFGGDIEALGTACLQAWADAFQAQLSSQVTLTAALVTLGSDGGEPLRATVAGTPGFQGTSGTDKLPQNCALLVRKNSNLGGRRHRGRMFLPGVLHESNVSNVGIIDPSQMPILTSYCVTLFQRLEDPLGTSPASPMVILHSTGNTTVPAPTLVSSLTVDNVISTQRRRLR